MARLNRKPRIGGLLRQHTGRLGCAGLAFALMAPLSSGVAAQDKGPPPKSEPTAESKDPKPAVVKGEIVSELDKAIWHVFQAKNGDYWFGSDDRGQACRESRGRWAAPA